MTKVDEIGPADFLTELKRRASTESYRYADPLATALLLIQENPITAECRALKKLIVVLESKSGSFRKSELWLFSNETSGLASALIDARLEGRYKEEDWKRAGSDFE